MKRISQLNYLQITGILLDLRIPNSQRTYEYHTTDKRGNSSLGITEKHEIIPVGSGAGGVCGGQGRERESEARAAVYCGGGGDAEAAGAHGDV